MKKLFCIILLLLFLTSSTGQSQPLRDSKPLFGQQFNLGHWSTRGLTGFWPFVEAGNLVDFSFTRNNGTILGATWVPGGLTYADESTDVIQLGQTVPYSDDFTIIVSGLFSSSGGSDNGYIIDWQTGSSVILFQSSARIRFIRDHATTDGVWQSPTHTFPWDTTFAITSKGADAPKFYNNGVEETFSEFTGPADGLVAQSGATWIGNNYASRVRSLDGTLRHILIYNRALSASEIQQLYINPWLPIEQEPIWNFYSPAAPSGIVPIIQAHNRRRRAS